MNISKEEYKHLVENLKLKLTPDFLDTMTECVRIIGWEVDLVETHDFLSKINNLSGKETPPIDQYEIDWST